ncbi:MAG: COX15/CtaA family protein [Dermatophilaceae bacterium]
MLLPVARTTWVRPILLANLVGEIVIVVTGGVVRLTGSGLGCPTWPECTVGSVVPVSEQVEGFHKWIEFGNRTLTGVVGILALLSLWAVVTHLPKRRPLHWLGWAMVGGVVAQALVGGITVRTGLNPATVAFHFLLSMAMVALATALVRGAEDELPAPRMPVVPRLVVRLGWVTAAVAAVVLVLGTLVTGSGPHSGDAVTPARTGFDPRYVSWMHADAVMLFLGLVVAMVVAVQLAGDAQRARTTWRTVLVVALAQGLIGYTQFFTGLPEVLVALHMLGAALLTVAVTAGVLNLYRNPV